MKITNLLTKTVVLTLCLSSAVFASAGPVGKYSETKKIIDALLRDLPRATRGKPSHFSYPQATAAAIRKAIEEQRSKRPATPGASRHTPPVALGHTPQEMRFYVRSLLGSDPIQKRILRTNSEAEKFYAPELKDAAPQLYALVSEIKAAGPDFPFNDKDLVTIATSVSENIKNHSLQTYLLESLATQDWDTFLLDLAEYFSLNESVEQAALNYILRHPHQQTLMTRRLTHNPLVDEDKKAAFLQFLSKPNIEPNDFPAFKAAVKGMYDQYQERLAAAAESDNIQTQINYYIYLIESLEDFLVKHNGQRPEWNTASQQEADLYEEIEWVLNNIKTKINRFEPFASYENKLKMLWEASAPTYLTKEETLALFEEFVKTTHRMYPRSLRDKPEPKTLPAREVNRSPHLGRTRHQTPSYTLHDRFVYKERTREIPCRWEKELWNNLNHYFIEDPSIASDIYAIQKKYQP